MYCRYCGKELMKGATFCGFCGMRQDLPEPPDPPEQADLPEPRRVVSAGGLVFDGGTDDVRVREKQESVRPVGFQGRAAERRWNADDGLKHRNRNEVRPKRDKNFTKFLAQPLPLRPVKITMSAVLLILACFAAYNAVKAGAIDVLRSKNATGPSVAGLYLAVLWAISAGIGFFVRFSKGATVTAGLLLLLAAGFAVTTKEEVPFGLYYALASTGAAITFLVSGVGGVDLSDFE